MLNAREEIKTRREALRERDRERGRAVKDVASIITNMSTSRAGEVIGEQGRGKGEREREWEWERERDRGLATLADIGNTCHSRAAQRCGLTDAGSCIRRQRRQRRAAFAAHRRLRIRHVQRVQSSSVSRATPPTQL